MTLRARLVTGVLAGLVVTTCGCGGPAQLTPEERRDAEVRWDEQFGPQVEHGANRKFGLEAEWRDDSVLMTVRARQSGVTFSDSSLGAGLFAYRDGEWHEVGDSGPSLQATRPLSRGETVQISIRVRDDDAPLYRAAVRVVTDTGVSLSWVALPPR